MTESTLLGEVTARAQARFEDALKGNENNPFSVAWEAVFGTLRELTHADYAKLLVEQPQLLDVGFVTKAIPVETFTVRRLLGDALVVEIEKRIKYDALDRAVLEKHARREPPPHMAENFAAALSAKGISKPVPTTA